MLKGAEFWGVHHPARMGSDLLLLLDHILVTGVVSRGVS